MTAQIAMIMISINLWSFVLSIRGSCIFVKLASNEFLASFALTPSLGFYFDACYDVVNAAILPPLLLSIPLSHLFSLSERGLPGQEASVSHPISGGKPSKLSYPLFVNYTSLDAFALPFGVL